MSSSFTSWTVLASAVTVCLVSSAAAQTPAGAPAIVGVAELGATVQSYTVGEGAAVNQTSVPFGVGIRHRSGAGLSLRATAASAGGDDLETLSGLAGIRATASYLRRIAGGSVEAALTARSAGSGTTLDPAQFATAAAIATEDFAFAVPSLGQGAALAPSLNIAIPAGPSAAFGVGASYISRGSFVPFEGDDASYTPASEIAMTAGWNTQIGRASTFSLDAAYVSVGDDTFGDDVFSPGDRVTGTARWAFGGGLVRGRLLMRYRHVFDGELPTADEARAVAYVRPEHAQVATGLQFVQNGTGVELTAGARYYGVFSSADSAVDILNVLGEQQLLVDLGLSPTVRVMSRLQLQGTFVYTLGVAEVTGGESLSGFRAGGGLRASF